MPAYSKPKSRNAPVEPKRAPRERSRASSFRLLPLLLIGLLLIGVALLLRSNHRLHEFILRGKDLPDLEALVRSQPEDALAQYYLAKQYYLARRFPEARTAYEAAVRLEPDSARAHLGLALTLYDLGQRQLAQSELAEALRHDNHLAWAEYMLGKMAWQEGNTAEALPHMQRAAQLDPRSDPAWFGLAVCYIQAVRHNDALSAMQQAVARKPASAQYQTALGELYVYLEKPDEGRQHYEQALQLDPNFGPACALMGELYLHNTPGTDALDRAEKLLLRATKLPTYRPQDVYLDLGELYIQKTQYKQAVAALQTASRIEIRDERPYYLLEKAYRRMGDTQAADAAEKRFRFISDRHVQQGSLQAYLSRHPDDADAYLRLARVYRDLGLTQQAIGQYLAYHRLKPDSPEVGREYEQFLEQKRAQKGPNPLNPGALNRDFALPPLR